jgi:hypothetical protein
MLRSSTFYDAMPGAASPATPSAPPTHDIVGKKLARRLRKGLSPTFAALLAREFETGESRLRAPLTRRQACLLTEASWGYVSALARATPEEIEAIKRGTLSLAALHRRKREPTDAQVDATIIKLGIERVFDALDRLTKPSISSSTAVNMTTADTLAADDEPADWWKEINHHATMQAAE